MKIRFYKKQIPCAVVKVCWSLGSILRILVIRRNWMEIQISFHHLRWFKWKHRRFLSRWKTSFGLRRRLNILSFSREQIQTTRELYVDWYWIRFQIHFWFIYLNHCWSLSQHRCWKYCTRLFYLCFDLVYLVLVLYGIFFYRRDSMMISTISGGSLLMIIVLFWVGGRFAISEKLEWFPVIVNFF